MRHLKSLFRKHPAASFQIWFLTTRAHTLSDARPSYKRVSRLHQAVTCVLPFSTHYQKLKGLAYQNRSAWDFIQLKIAIVVVVSARPDKRGCGTSSLELVVLGESPLLWEMHWLLILGFWGEFDWTTRVGLLGIRCEVSSALLRRSEV